MADNEIRNPAKAYFKWKMPVIIKSEDDWNFWNTEDKYNRTMFIGYNDTTTPHVASLFMIVDGKPMQAVGDDVLARIAGLETNTAQALADIQTLIDRVNAQQLEISNLQQECERILAQAADAVTDAQTWAEGTDADVADLGGEHSAKGWAQKANDIVAAGLPSDATFDHLTVTGSSKFGQDPDRENQPGLEIEGTGEIQAYRTVNMMNGATVSYDETVDMPWSDSSNKVPNTAWVQQAVQHGTIDPNTELTVKRITARDKGAYLMTAYTSTTGSKQQASLSLPKVTSDTGSVYIELKASNAADNTSGQFSVYPHFIQMAGHQVYIRGTATTANYNAPVVFGSSTISASETKKIMSSYVGHFANGLLTGLPDANWGDGIPFRVVRTKAATGNWEAVFGVTPTVPDITDATDSSSKVPNTKWVQAAIAAGGGSGGGAVTSVNGKTGEVVLSATDVGAAPADALAGYVTTEALNTELADYATNASVDTKLGSYQPKLTAGDGIAISDTNVISVTGGTGGAVSSVNGKTGEVVLNAADVGAITGAEADTKITTALEPYAKTADVTKALSGYATTDDLTLGLKGKQDELTAGTGITISADNVISATGGGTGGGAVDSVNGKTGAVVLTGEDIRTSSYPESATIATTFGSFAQMIDTKQDKLTDTTDLTVRSLTAGDTNSGLSAGQYSMKFTSGGHDKLFVNSLGPYVSNLTGGDTQLDTGEFNWYINTTTDYNKFNVFNRYYVTDEATQEVTTYDTCVLSVGGSPTDHSTWIDFTADYLSFKGNANFGETGMNHNMNFNGPSTFNNTADFRDSTNISGNVTFWKSDAEGGITPWASYDKSTGVFNIDYLTSTDGGTSANRVTIMADSREANYGATFNLPVTVSDASFKRTSTLAADDNSTEVPTTAWVKSAIASSGGSVPDDITCKTLKVTGTATVHELIAGDGYEGTMFTCNTDANLNYNVNIGWTSGRLKCMRDEYNWLFDFNRNASPGSMLRFNDTVTILSAMPAATDSSTTVPTTAWVQSAIAAGGGGGVPDDITCKTLKVTEWDSGLDSIEFAGNLKYSGDYGNGSLGIITAREFYANASGYYSTRVSTSGIILSYGSGGNQWLNADSNTRTLTIDGTLKSSTPDAGSNNTDVATTAWVNTAITSKAASTNADNFSVAGKKVLAGMGMPSSKHLDITVGANGTTYTAPANGYFFSVGNFSQDNGAIRLLNNTKHSIGTDSKAAKAWYYAVFVPCQKGDEIAIFYQSVNGINLTFVYAEGDQEGENNV